MSSPTNADRVEWGEAAIATEIAQTGTDRETALVDLLADLMHWARAENQSFDDALSTARMHFEEEEEGRE